MQDEHRIRQRAYEIWEREGRPAGRHDEHWDQARRELAGGGVGARVPDDSPTVTAPDAGGTTPAEAAAAADAVDPPRRTRATATRKGRAGAGTRAPGDSPTLAAPDAGGATPGEAAAAVGTPRRARTTATRKGRGTKGDRGEA